VLAVVLLAAFGATDWVDGFLARRLGQTSAVGTVLDPVCDRVGVVAIILAFVAAGDLQLWVILLIVGVDVALGVVFLVRKPGAPPAVVRLGKVRTAVLMTGVALLGVGLPATVPAFTVAGRVLCAIGALLHLATGAVYLRRLLAPRAVDR
jgi:cardiolipin synthase (CMP-forming)